MKKLPGHRKSAIFRSGSQRDFDQSVDDELSALPFALRVCLSRMVEMIERVGLEQVHEPYIKHLEDKLLGIRAKEILQ